MLSVTIGKKATFNTGNYSSIQPSVSVTLDGIKPEEYEIKVEQLNVLVDALFTKNVMEHSEWAQLTKDHGLNVVLNSINLDGMNDDVKKALEKLDIKKGNGITDE